MKPIVMSCDTSGWRIPQPYLRVYRFTRVVFGVSSSPFLLNATIRFHLEKYLETSEGLVRHLLRSTYVDNILSGGPTKDEAFSLYTASKKIFCEEGFNLRNFSDHFQTPSSENQPPGGSKPRQFTTAGLANLL